MRTFFSETKLISGAYCAHDIPGIIYIFGKKVIGTVAMAKLIIHHESLDYAINKYISSTCNAILFRNAGIPDSCKY